MKKILITGANSYVGTSVEKYLKQWPDNYKLDTIDMRNGEWRKKSFADYDTVFHVAGIVHSDTEKLTEEKRLRYRRINTNLAIETARKAEREGVKQFIFMSSSVVYGETPKIGENRIITKETVPHPNNCYGESKLRAEEGILKIEKDSGNSDFKVVILRSPVIYGKNSKGNYPTLSKIAGISRFFPYVDNCRSMLYIENLAELIRLIILNEERGVFFPQNKEYTNTSKLVKEIREVKGKKTNLVRGFTWLLKFMNIFSKKISKAFGSWHYMQDMSIYKQEYRLVDFKESIRRTEG